MTEICGESTLRRDYLSPVGSMAQVLGFMTPTGVLGVTVPLMILSSGNAAGPLFLCTLVIFLFLSMTMNTFATRCVSAGSLATFARLGLGPRWGAVAGWAYLIGLAYSANIAAVASADYLDITLAKIAGAPAGTSRVCFLTLVVFLGVWLTAHRDIKLSTEMMLYIEAISLLVMVSLLGLIVYKYGAWFDRDQFALAGVHPGDLQPGFVFAFTCLAGFESVLALGEESRNALKSIPRVMLFCVLALGIFFFLVTYGLVAVWHRGGLTPKDFEDPFVVIAGKVHLPFLGVASSLGVALSFFACSLASVNAGARVLFSMARDGAFWPGFAVVHPRNATPSRTIALFVLFGLSATLGFLGCGFGTGDAIDYLSSIGTFGFVTAYLCVAVAAPMYLRQQGALSRRVIVESVLSATAMVVVLALNLYPVPPAPNCYYVLIFLGFLLTGAATSLLQPWRGRKIAFAEVSDVIT